MIEHAYILAGGASRRFGSDKARALRNDLTNIQCLAQDLSNCGLTVTAVAQQASQFADLGIPTIADWIPNGGPLIGIYSALLHAKRSRATDWVLIITCDALSFQQDWLVTLRNGIRQDAGIVIFHDHRLQPFPGLYRTSLWEDLDHFIVRNERSVTGWLSSMQHLVRPMDCPTECRPQQFNTIEELNRFRAADPRG